MPAKDRLARAWRRLLARKGATPWEHRKSASTLEALARDPWACEDLACRLGIEVDPGESAASFVAEMAQEAANEIRANDARTEADYYLRRKTSGLAHD